METLQCVCVDTRVFCPWLSVRKQTLSLCNVCIMCHACVHLSSRVRTHTHTIRCVLSSVFLEELINIQQEAE